MLILKYLLEIDILGIPDQKNCVSFWNVIFKDSVVQVNLDMTDSVGPGKLVRHMRNPSYAYDGLSLWYASVYLIALGTSVDL